MKLNLYVVRSQVYIETLRLLTKEHIENPLWCLMKLI